MASNEAKDTTAAVDVAGPSQDVAGPDSSTQENQIRGTATDEQMMAREGDAPPELPDDETVTPPHGDKLRSEI